MVTDQPGSGSIAKASGDPFEALGDPHRRDILRLLKEAGLVAEQAQGTRRIYHLREEGLRAVQAYLEQVWGDAARRFRLMAENIEP